ncbi:MAG: oligosaccharyl transferase, archaeosortase A system-associated [Halobacteriota archaeon]
MVERMQRRDESRNKNKNKKGRKVTLSGIKIASILLVFCGLAAFISLLHVLSASGLRLSVQGILDIFALSAFPIAYGIWMRKKWAFYAALILLEAFIIIYPLTAAFSPPSFLEENWVCLLSFIVVGIIAVLVLISNKSYFIEEVGTQKGVNLHELIKRLPVFNILYVIFGISLIIRAVLPYDRVFGGAMVMFGSDDPVYHIRLIENMLFGNHFPHRIYFDPYTQFPHGNHLHFTPLYDYLPAFFTWLIGLGAPTHRLMETVAAYYPAVLGALVVFPVYFIGKEVYSKEVGLLSAFLIAILPGFLFRSILGATDHHVGEVLFSTIAMMFLVMALKRAKASGITFKHIAKGDWSSLKTPLVYIFLAGFSFGLYALTWIGCVLFVFIVFVAFFAIYLIEHLRGNSTDYLCVVGVPLFLIPLLMIAPFLRYPNMYSSSHVASLLIGALVVSVLSAISVVMARKKIVPYAYPIALLGMGIVILAFLNALFPSLYASLIGAFGWVKHGIGMQVIGEMHPMTLDAALRNFSTCFYISLAAFAFVIYGIIKKWRPEETLLLVWSFINLLILGVIFDMMGMSPIPIGQNRFVYYYAVNVALLCGLFAVQVTMLSFAFLSETGKEKKEEKRVKGKQKKEERQRQKVESKKKERSEHGIGISEIKKYGTTNRIIVLFIVIFIVFYPFPLNITNSFPENMPDNFKWSYYHAKGGPSVFPADWYESLLWMRNNTPDPGVDYYALYEVPPYNKTAEKREEYKYPESAYGVMSWWDYGHVITLYAHRIPNSNPFQAGIGGRNEDGSIRPGASTFFVSRDEEEANWILDELGTRYVISDFMMADAFNAYYNKFGAITTWAGDTGGYYVQMEIDGEPRIVPSAKYYSTMEARLHLFDGTGVALSEEFYLAPLRHYRLIHESPSTIISFGGQEIKFVKTFEYVKGARIEGTAPNGSFVEVSTNITTNRGREFVYSARALSNGTYEFVVPYSTEEPVEGGTNFDVFASPYKIRAGHVENVTMVWDVEREVSVPEAAVMAGKTIRVELFE